ncbi:YcaO-like family protein [Pseudoruegeria sp. HB172150]|uniref:YcaO-like family protein n=1 Tax=Pseudoruegeria sp. HB172150 TaxID=2721164 RepID=UPI001C12D762|nr:YcaO-like family protein [Pseudoruegeria sp. HB172150]
MVGDRPKIYWDGTHRAAVPEETWDRIQPLLSRAGVTRIGELTSLDRIGLPVAQAIRPMSRALTTSQGKGTTPVTARVSAGMEALEKWHAEILEKPDLKGTSDHLSGSNQVVDLERATLTASGPAEAMAGTELSWVEGVSLWSGDPILVPWDYVHLDTTAPCESSLLPRGSNGLASGNTRPEAIFAGLCEVIERDAVADFRALDARARARRRVGANAISRTRFGDLTDMIVRAGFTLDVWNAQNDLGVPVFVATITPRPGTDAPVAGLSAGGSGCHLDPEIALVRAVLEAVQSRLTRISGARDDLASIHFGQARNNEIGAFLAQFFEEPVFEEPIESAALGDCAGEDIHVLAGRLNAAGCDEPVVVDLSLPDTDIHVVRVVTPDLGIVGPNGSARRGARHTWRLQ